MKVDFGTLESRLTTLASLFENEPALRTTLKPLLDLRPVLRRPTVQLTFLGAFKAGKSTLLNAIVGSPLLPSRTNRATGVITRIAYGPTLAAWIVRNDRREPIFFDDLARYILLDLSGPTATARPDIQEVQLTVPLPLLQERCRLVDTPGLMDNPDLTAVTLAELGRTDLAVLVLSADKLVSQAEREAALRAHALLNGNLVFVVNRLDLVDEDDRQEVLEWAHSAFAGLGNGLVGQPRVFATQAKGTLDQRKKNRPVASTGLVEFEDWLQTLLDGPDAPRLIKLSRLGLLSQARSTVSQALQSQLTACQTAITDLEKTTRQAQATSQTRFRQEVAQARARLDQYRGRLDEPGANFSRTTLAQGRSLLTSHPATNLNDLLQTVLQTYTSEVSQGLRAAVGMPQLHIPTFGLSPYRADLSLEAAGSSGWFDGAFDRTGVNLNVDEVLGRLGRLGNDLFGNGSEARLRQLEQSLNRLRPLIKEEAEVYLFKVEGLLIELSQTAPPDVAEPPALVIARQEAHRLQLLLNWCDDFALALKRET